MDRQVPHQVERPELPMSNTLYKQWYEAITRNDIESMYSIQNSDGVERMTLLNGQFIFKNNEVRKDKNEEGTSSFKQIAPLCIAAVSGCVDALLLLIAEGADVTIKERNGFNILHCLAVTSAMYEEKEEQMIDIYKQLLEVLEQGTINKLHKMEENFGDRPLEFAAKQGTFGLMMAFFNTKEVYLDRTEKRGPFRYNFYDITDYESHRKENKERQLRSPLVHLQRFDRRKLDNPYAMAMFEDHALIHQWIKRKRNIYKYLLIIWFIIRMSYFATFIIIDSDEKWVTDKGGISEESFARNSSSFNSNKTYYIYCQDFTVIRSPYIWYEFGYFGIYYLISFGMDIVILIKYISDKKLQKYMKTCVKTVGGNKKNSINNQAWYSVTNFLTNQGLTQSVASYLSPTSSIQGVAFRFLGTVTSIWSILYFIQLMPRIGHFIVGIQNMMKEVFKFFIVFIAILIPFAQLLIVFANTNSKEGCLEEFSSVERTAYSIVLVMQNMLNFEVYDMNKQYLFFAIHVSLVFILPIVLVNFLIAIMVSSLTYLEGKEHVVSDLLNLQAGQALEFYFETFMSRYNRWMVKKHFWVENGKVFVVIVVPAG